MSAHIALQIVRTRTVVSLERFLLSDSPTALSRLLGVAPSTMQRRAPELPAWSACELITAAAHHTELREALGSWHRPDEIGRPLLAEAGCRAAVGVMGGEIAKIMARLDDGFLDRAEAEATERELAEIEQQVAIIRADLRAKARGEVVR